MKSRALAAVPGSLLLACTVGCSAAPIGQTEGASGLAEAVVACPTETATDDQMRAAATAAFNLMRDAAAVGGAVAPIFSNTILASQRYQIQSSGTGIQFNPSDPLYKYVSNKMQADLAFAQQDPTVAQFLSEGLSYAQSISNGWYFPSVGAISVLANFTYPGPTTAHIADTTSSNNSHQATATGVAWCGTESVTIAETVSDSWSFSPLYSLQITNPGVGIGGGWLNNPPAGFRGSSAIPTTPFNGPSSTGNPYLVVGVDGSATNWATYNFNAITCYANPPSNTCTGTLQLDPVPYAEPGQYYNTAGLVGTQANPFTLDSTVLYATPDHASQWATRTVSGTQQWGTFSKAVTLLGVTEYEYEVQ